MWATSSSVAERGEEEKRAQVTEKEKKAILCTKMREVQQVAEEREREREHTHTHTQWVWKGKRGGDNHLFLLFYLFFDFILF